MSARMNITVPDALKARMDAVTEPVNWSATAAEAFAQQCGSTSSVAERERTLDSELKYEVLGLLADLRHWLMCNHRCKDEPHVRFPR